MTLPPRAERPVVSSPVDVERDRRLAIEAAFAARVMHEVNNTLNAVVAAVYLVETHADDARAVAEHTQRINDAVQASVERLAPLRHFMRQEPIDHHPAPVDVAAVFREALAVAQPVGQRDAGAQSIIVATQLPPGVLVRVANDELRVALLALIHNALEAMPQGGTLFVSVAERDDRVIAVVRDTGNGMTDAVSAQAFNPLFTTKRDRHAGLGLSVVYGIARRHRGNVDIESSHGRGTMVTLSFPVVPAGT